MVNMNTPEWLGPAQYQKYVDSTIAVTDLDAGDDVWIPSTEVFDYMPRGRVVHVRVDGPVVRIIYRNVKYGLIWGGLRELLLEPGDRLQMVNDKKWMPPGGE